MLSEYIDRASIRGDVSLANASWLFQTAFITRPCTKRPRKTEAQNAVCLYWQVLLISKLNFSFSSTQWQKNHVSTRSHYVNIVSRSQRWTSFADGFWKWSQIRPILFIQTLPSIAPRYICPYMYLDSFICRLLGKSSTNFEAPLFLYVYQLDIKLRLSKVERMHHYSVH